MIWGGNHSDRLGTLPCCSVQGEPSLPPVACSCNYLLATSKNIEPSLGLNLPDPIGLNYAEP